MWHTIPHYLLQPNNTGTHPIHGTAVRDVRYYCNRGSIPLEAKLLKASTAGIRKVCVRPPALRKLRTYDADFSNDGHPPTPPPCRWPALITLPTLAKFQLVWAPPLCCCAVPFLLPVRVHPYGRPCTTRVTVL